ncbi:unnamed protein product [Gadus morhua 'NCC']
MWLLPLSVPLLGLLALLARQRGILAAGRGALNRVLRWARGPACPRRTHAFVFSQCTHGRADSVLETFDLHAETHHTLELGRVRGVELDEVVVRAAPRRVLELGLGCGYSAVRTLRLLPPGGRLLAVEADPLSAELGEELVLVAGFKHHQFEVLTCSSAEAIAGLRRPLHGDQGEEEGGLDLVLMDHDPQHYLPDLRALEGWGLLRPGGCLVLMVFRGHDSVVRQEVLEHVGSRPQSYSSSVRSGRGGIMEVQYREETISLMSSGDAIG